jgi:hypothetical protein
MDSRYRSSGVPTGRRCSKSCCTVCVGCCDQAGLAAISAMVLARRIDRTFLVRGMRDLRCVKPIGAGCVGHKTLPSVEAGHGKYLF